MADRAVILCLNWVSLICLYLFICHKVSHHILEYPFKQKPMKTFAWHIFLARNSRTRTQRLFEMLIRTAHKKIGANVLNSWSRSFNVWARFSNVPNLHGNNEFVPLREVLTYEWHNKKFVCFSIRVSSRQMLVTFPFFHWQQGNRPILQNERFVVRVVTAEKLGRRSLLVPKVFHLPITGSGILGAVSMWFFYCLMLCQLVWRR